MNFEEFAAGYGLIIDHVEYGAWRRVKTVDHPNKRNGAYLHRGDVAWVQNHATMGEPDRWVADRNSCSRTDQAAIDRRCKEAARELQQARQRAANKAGWIMRQCSLDKHAYLDSKGFPDALGNVWHRDGEQPLLCIPMMVSGAIVGVQLISVDGQKKFLAGQRCMGAEYVIDNKGRDWYCEGYATGLSLRALLSSLKLRYRIHICFSAHNMASMAKDTDCVVVADNDISGTGSAAAIKSGRPFYLPPCVGYDLNDMHKALGTFHASQELRKFIYASL